MNITEKIIREDEQPIKQATNRAQNIGIVVMVVAILVLLVMLAGVRFLG